MNKANQFYQPYTFVGIMGLSPAVITETLYGLWEMAGGERNPEGLKFPDAPHVFPKRIVIITTNSGKEKEKELKQKICSLFNTYHPDNKKWDIENTFFKDDNYFKIVSLGSKETNTFGKAFSESFKELIFDEIKAIKDYENAEIDRRIIAGMTGGFVPMYSALRSALEFLGGPQDKAYNVYLECDNNSFTGKDVEHCSTFFAPLPKHLSKEETIGISKHKDWKSEEEIIKEIDLRQISVSINLDDIIPHGSFLANTYALESKDAQWISRVIKLCASKEQLTLYIPYIENPKKFHARLCHPYDDTLTQEIPLDSKCYLLLRNIARASILKKLNLAYLWPITIKLGKKTINDTQTIQKRWQFTCLFEYLSISTINNREKTEIISAINSFNLENEKSNFIASKKSLSHTKFIKLIKSEDKESSASFIDEAQSILSTKENNVQFKQDNFFEAAGKADEVGPANPVAFNKILLGIKAGKKYILPEYLVNLLGSHTASPSFPFSHYPENTLRCVVEDISSTGDIINFEEYMVTDDIGKLRPINDDPYKWLRHYHELHSYNGKLATPES